MTSTGSAPPRYELTFLRHAQSVGNAEKRHQGQADFPLTEKGRRQIQALAAYWKEAQVTFDLILTSPLSRAQETAQTLADHLDLPLKTDPVWMERDNGKLAGLLHDEAEDEIPRPDFIPLHQPIAKTGESQWELYLRAGKALNKLITLEPGCYLIVGHGGQFNMVMHAVVGAVPQPNFQGPRFRFSNTGFTRVTHYPQEGYWDVHQHNVRPHLDIKG